MKSVKCVLAAVMAALVFGPVSVSAQQPGQDAYQVGQRLGQDTKTSAGAFKEISWDDLIPADWNPEKFFIDLKLDDLQDNDPRAMEVMQKIREEWDRAPLVQRFIELVTCEVQRNPRPNLAGEVAPPVASGDDVS